MSEVMREPFFGTDKDGIHLTIFDENHSLADICRWIMQNRSEAEEVHLMLGQMLDGTFGETMQ